MTPAQLEHLRKIDTHLEKLLLKATHRTTGLWNFDSSKEATIITSTNQVVVMTGDIGGFLCDDDGEFVASCAGNAEAGWLATRTTIAVILSLTTPDEPAAIDSINGILSAFPLSLIESYPPPTSENR